MNDHVCRPPLLFFVAMQAHRSAEVGGVVPALRRCAGHDRQPRPGSQPQHQAGEGDNRGEGDAYNREEGDAHNIETQLAASLSMQDRA